ncbi:ChrR-like anti-ECFsigma factor [Gemmobacter caeni]|jgi:putative transcriptional regulator|uniref:ChrR-like anti-ECFsigma factor n=1 Tax=Gemmobacter caeni TaxID=589035 RepID=A0A2T6AWL7_9RHOB|nr:ChrR family anti-sigma-E factor [Gemmobacter caeni]PTX48209.1 ChrR-like anti-ECFsigma factor [Gemmobacter caeni]TWI96925.1 ChrR-like anti-ECFsigma factor [Gemmobacter caeni]
MTQITHHIPDDILDAWRAGALSHPYAVVVAAHLSLCDECRAAVETADMIGGALLDGLEGQALDAGARQRMMDALDTPAPPPVRGSGVFPAPVVAALGGQPPQWRMLGGGIRQQILSADREGALRLLYIPPGRAVPEHGHRGLELTLVLQGSFSDSEGAFLRGDVETAHDSIDHQPVAGPGAPCICLAATDAPLRFHALLPRLLQPIFRI